MKTFSEDQKSEINRELAKYMGLGGLISANGKVQKGKIYTESMDALNRVIIKVDCESIVISKGIGEATGYFFVTIENNCKHYVGIESTLLPEVLASTLYNFIMGIEDE